MRTIALILVMIAAGLIIAAAIYPVALGLGYVVVVIGDVYGNQAQSLAGSIIATAGLVGIAWLNMAILKAAGR